MAHADLRAHGHEMPREGVVVFGQTAVGDHQVVDAGEGEGALGLVVCLCFEEGGGVGFPVAARVEVVGGVVAVVEAVAVGLGR